jgi:HEAT repeat protein
VNTIVTIIVLAVAVCVPALAQDVAEPIYKGMSLSEWRQALQNADPALRAAAIAALEQIHKATRGLPETMVKGLKDKDVAVRRAAAAALERLGNHGRKEAAIALGSLGAKAKDALPALMAATKDNSVNVRKAAVAAVEKIRAK